MKPGLRRLLSVPLAACLMMAFVLPAAAGQQVGSLTCSSNQRAWIFSKASVNVWHIWTEGSQYFYNPYRLYKENNTQQQAIGWKVTWDFEKDYAGAECHSIRG